MSKKVSLAQRVQKSWFFKVATYLDKKSIDTGSRFLEWLAGLFLILALIDWRKAARNALLLVTGFILAVVFMCIQRGVTAPQGSTYPQTLLVVDVQTFDNCAVVTFKTCQGFLYTYVTPDKDFAPLEMYSAIMDDMGTRMIADDAIVKLRYVRF